jgi:hypothetical protein
MKNSTIVSADVQIGDHPGFAVIEILDNGIKIFIERYYPTVSDIEVLVAISENREEIIKIYNDWGDYYDSIPKMERSIK